MKFADRQVWGSCGFGEWGVGICGIEDSIGPDGLEHLFGDLQINAEDIVTLAFSWKLGAKTLCVLTKDEFVSGLEQLRVDSLKDLKVAMGTNAAGCCGSGGT